MNKLTSRIHNFISEKYASKFRYAPFVHTILIHKIFPDKTFKNRKYGSILEGLDRRSFEIFLKYFSKRKVSFINELDILAGNLNPEKKYIFLTFDDGYFNNLENIDLFEKYNTKATFYISTNHIKYGKAYWWDALARESLKRGESETEYIRQTKMLHKMRWQEQESYLRSKFGSSALEPKSSLERPLSSMELIELANHPLTRLGNHTHNHLNLTLYSTEEIESSLFESKDYLETLTGQKILSISYPYGFYDNRITKIVNKNGYKFGITVDSGKNKLEDFSESDEKFCIKRSQLSGNMDMESQCRNILVEFSLVNELKKLL